MIFYIKVLSFQILNNEILFITSLKLSSEFGISNNLIHASETRRDE